MAKRMTSSALRKLAITMLIGLGLTVAAPANAEEKEAFVFEEVTVEELTIGYQNGDFTVAEVVKAHLNRIGEYEDRYQAFTFINHAALWEARQMDKRMENGEDVGKLAGIPIVIKETIDVVGFASTFGWEGFSRPVGGIEIMPEVDAPIIQRLKEEGAIILGKTNIPAFSTSGTRTDTSWAGTTLNVVNSRFAPGGSSSGTATAVSGNFSVLGIGEETGGSIQNPAAAQAIVGVKPTFGLVANTGVVPLAANTRDVLGPHTRTVKDAALLLDVIAGENEQDPKTEGVHANIPNEGYVRSLELGSLEGKRIGLYGPSWRVNSGLHVETELLYERVVDELQSLGAEVVVDPFAGSGFAEFVDGAGNIGYDALVSDFHYYLKRLDPEGNLSSISELFKQVNEVPWAPNGPLEHFQQRGVHFEKDLQNPSRVPDLSEFWETRERYTELIGNVVNEHELDGFVYPQMITSIPSLEGKEDHAETTVPEINIGGLPLVTIPAGYYGDGSPFAIVFFGEMWSEAELLSMAYDYEQATEYREAPKLVAEPDKEYLVYLVFIVFGSLAGILLWIGLGSSDLE